MKLRLPALLALLVVIPLFFVYLLAEVCSPATSAAPKVRHGVLDLTGWDFQKDGVVKLDGEWEFYWKQLLTDRDWRGGTVAEPDYGTVPGMWNYYRHDGKHFPGYGYATYRVTVKTNDRSSVKGLKISALSTAYRLMVDDRVVAKNGKVGAGPRTFAPNTGRR
jgi:hypothetical protein